MRARILLSVCVAALSACTSVKNETQYVPHPMGVGYTMTDSSIKVTGPTGGAEFRMWRLNQFLVAEIAFRNGGSDPITIGYSEFVLIDHRGEVIRQRAPHEVANAFLAQVGSAPYYSPKVVATTTYTPGFGTGGTLTTTAQEDPMDAASNSIARAIVSHTNSQLRDLARVTYDRGLANGERIPAGTTLRRLLYWQVPPEGYPPDVTLFVPGRPERMQFIVRGANAPVPITLCESQPSVSTEGGDVIATLSVRSTGACRPYKCTYKDAARKLTPAAADARCRASFADAKRGL